MTVGGEKIPMLVSELEDYAIAFAYGVAEHVPVVPGAPRRRYAYRADCVSPAVDLRLLDWPRRRSLRNLPVVAGLGAMARRERPSLIHLRAHASPWPAAASPFRGPAPLATTVHDATTHPGDRQTAACRAVSARARVPAAHASLAPDPSGRARRPAMARAARGARLRIDASRRALEAVRDAVCAARRRTRDATA